MRKSLIAAAAAAVLTSVVSVGVYTSSADAHPILRSFTVVERAVTDTVVDTGPKGDSLGDLLAFGNPIYDAADRARVGKDQGSCVRTVVGAAYECEWTTTLPGGSLVVTGPFYDAGDSTLAITGGTGKWAAAHGSMRLHARNAAGSEYDFTFTVI